MSDDDCVYCFATADEGCGCRAYADYYGSLTPEDRAEEERMIAAYVGEGV